MTITLRTLFDYQRFFTNLHLHSKIDAVYEKYLVQGVALSDEELNVSAAGDTVLPVIKPDRHGDE